MENFKIVVLGEARVGKTSMTIRFVKNKFDLKQKSTLNAQCLNTSLRITAAEGSGLPGGMNTTYKISVWDTAGQEEHHCVNKVYYRGAQGALIVYDITDTDSFTKMSMWV